MTTKTSGQASIEFIVVSLVLFKAFILTSIFSYYLVARKISDEAAYRTMLCYISESSNYCIKNFKNLSKYLKGLKIKEVKLDKRSTLKSYHLSISWIEFYQIPFLKKAESKEYVQKLSVPKYIY